jgi:hypothetical protein
MQVAAVHASCLLGRCHGLMSNLVRSRRYDPIAA